MRSIFYVAILIIICHGCSSSSSSAPSTESPTGTEGPDSDSFQLAVTGSVFDEYGKWAVLGPMYSPAQYAVVPGAAIQDIPSDGNPPRENIQTDDLIRNFAMAPGDGFYEKSHEGLLQAP